jgi:hypothetical protein
MALDAVNGEVHVLPKEVAARLEQANHNGRFSVPLVGTDPAYDEAIVALGTTLGELSILKLPNGQEWDVRRLHLPGNTSEVKVHVVNTGAWRLTDKEVLGETEERCVQLSRSDHMVLPPSPTLPPMKSDRGYNYFCNFGDPNWAE